MRGGGEGGRALAVAVAITASVVAVVFLLAGPPVASRGTAPAQIQSPAPKSSASGVTSRSTIIMREREALPAALSRAGVGHDQVSLATAALADDFDVENAHPGQRLDVTLTRASEADAAPILVRLSLQTGSQARLELTPGPGGVLRLQRVDTRVYDDPSLVEGVVDGSLYLSLVGAGLSAETAAKTAAIFGRNLDLTRDLDSGDRFRLLFQQRRLADGIALGPPQLIYADLATRAGHTRLYRMPGVDGGEALVDAAGHSNSALLLRTPVQGARITSPFGMRLHPILGFSRMHQGVDFGAPSGAPVLAAGDGVVEQAGWSGGYGRWLKIRHSARLETGYAHLSGWAAGIVPGARVRQGQVVAFVGATGLATGPHLHYEVFENGVRIDPGSALLAATATPTSAEIAFRAQRARVDMMVSTIQPGCGETRPTAASCPG
jgi:murein DD-endopeptidase MepM/ murein hydrolase activator NlpD